MQGVVAYLVVGCWSCWYILPVIFVTHFIIDYWKVSRDVYKRQDTFTIDKKPDPIVYIEDIRAYNQQEGLALNEDEISYLESLSKKLNRRLTDSEVFGFSQVNSEHCRHKIFNGRFIIDGEEQEESLFTMIKKTSKTNPNRIVSAYKDNCAFIEGPASVQFAPVSQDKPDFYTQKDINTVISLKAETHNFPTTVEPFNGAATAVSYTHLDVYKRQHLVCVWLSNVS